MIHHHSSQAQGVRGGGGGGRGACMDAPLCPGLAGEWIGSDRSVEEPLCAGGSWGRGVGPAGLQAADLS